MKLCASAAQLPINRLEAILKFAMFPAALFAVLLSACGGGSGGGSSQAGQQPPPSGRTLASQPQVVAYYGDSTVRGYESGTGAQVATPAPTAFAQALPASPTQTVRNLGADGQTACQLLNADWAGQMATSDATVVILNHGINDSREDVGEDIETYKSCLTQIARVAGAAGKRVIFETPNPVDNSRIGDYVTAMKQVAGQERLSLIDQYAELTRYLNGRDLREFLCPDGTHPSQEIYIRKGQYAAQVYLSLPL
jgi:lysophospholipase L1-like esterase